MTTHVPDFDGLRLLVGIGRHGSIGASARAQGLTQQSASERVRGMEAMTGLTLVQRGARGSTLTPAGVVVAEWAARLLEMAEEIDTAIAGLRGDRDRDLVVWASMTVAETLLPRWLVLLQQRQRGEGYRPTTVSLHATNSRHVLDAVREGTATLGFVEGGDLPAGVRSQAVGSDTLVLVAAPGTPLARRRTPLEPAEVAALPLTNREPGSGTREVVERALAAHGLTGAAPVVEHTTATAVREAVIAGSAPAFLSPRLVGRDVDAGRLAVVPTRGLDLTRAFRAVWVGPPAPPAGPVRDLVGVARQT